MNLSHRSTYIKYANRFKHQALYSYIRFARQALRRVRSQPVSVLFLLTLASLPVAILLLSPNSHWRYLTLVASLFLLNMFGTIQIAIYSYQLAARASFISQQSNSLEILTNRLQEDQNRINNNLENAITSSEHDHFILENKFTEMVSNATKLAKDALAHERSERSLTIAHSIKHEFPIRKVLLQLTVPRSGSTRLFDFLRTHPAIRVSPTLDVWNAFEFSGRRYPGALSDVPGAWTPVEVSTGVGATIVTSKPIDLPSPSYSHKWMLEKAHPEFIDFDAGRLIRNISQMRSRGGIEVALVLGIRRPLDNMWSMAEYKLRTPTWHPHIDMADVPKWILDSLHTIQKIQEELGGTIVDFDDYPKHQSLIPFGKKLGDGWTDEDAKNWLVYGGKATGRDQRVQKSGEGFLGERDPERSSKGPNNLWTDLGDTLSEAEAIYQHILTNEKTRSSDKPTKI